MDFRFGKSGIELADTLATYMLYYGFYLYSSEKVENSILSVFIRKEEIGQHVMFTEPVGIGPIKNVTGVIEEEDMGQFPFVKTVSILMSGNKISFMDNIYKDLKDFEKKVGIGFPQKFYPYIDEFIKDIRIYSMRIKSNRIAGYEVEHILKSSYGNFTMNDLSTYYEDLFDGEFVFSGNGIKV